VKTIKLQFDYLQGPIWGEYYSIALHKSVTGIRFIDEDRLLQDIHKQMQDAYSSYYEFDGDGGACRFNQEKQKAEKEKMLEWLSALKNRLNELNDGSFQVEDLITPEYETL
jgi:dipeptidyl aminopeptidase/acylaminoacyl peptidase